MSLSQVKHVSVEFLSLSVKASKPGEWELPYISYIFIGMCPPPLPPLRVRFLRLLI